MEQNEERTEGTKTICGHCGEEHTAIETEECFNGFRTLDDTHTHNTDEDSAACDAYHATMREQMDAGKDYDAAQKLAREAADATHDDRRDAKKYRLEQAQQLMDGFEKAKGRPATSIEELTEWAMKREVGN